MEAKERTHSATLRGPSLIRDKVATPAEPAKLVESAFKNSRPMSIAAEGSSSRMTDSHDEVSQHYAKYQTLEVRTGSAMLSQFRREYIGLAHPFAIPFDVSGVDFLGEETPRRKLSADSLVARAIDMANWPGFVDNLADEETPSSQIETVASPVRMADFVHGMSQRVEAQYRRHWGFVPSLWNLHFRNEINLGMSLSARATHEATEATEYNEQDAAVAAAALYKLLETGVYKDGQGRRRRIDWDYAKLPYAIGLPALQKQLLAGFRFRIRRVAGTQDIRVKIGHLGFWAGVVYGNGIFMTVSPGERHNYLAVRLSRYRIQDPYVTAATKAADEERPWIRSDAPSLEAVEFDSYGFEVPGYDLRHSVQSKDPLCCANAFVVYIRVVLAGILGIRMCHRCPHCAGSMHACQDAMGSSAEAMGGLCLVCRLVFRILVRFSLHLHVTTSSMCRVLLLYMFPNSLQEDLTTDMIQVRVITFLGRSLEVSGKLQSSVEKSLTT